MPTAIGAIKTQSCDAETEGLEIVCEPADNVDPEQIILQLARALARMAAREDDERENAGSVGKSE